MKVEKNKVVSLHYKLSEGDKVLEDSHQASPMIYLHGHNGIFPKLEEELEGKAVGDTIAVTLAPEDGYGHYNENAIQRISINHVMRKGKKKEKYRPGMLVYLNTKNGAQPALVVKAGLKTLDVDLNHPFAGRTLHFDIEIIDIRDASQEEVDHGHVHGEGGHQH